MNTPTRNHEPSLLVDPGAGVLLDAPPNPIVTERYVQTHPFITTVSGYVIAGPDAQKVAAGNGGEEFVTYAVVRRVAGALHLQRLD
jgi:hypothetical protein